MINPKNLLALLLVLFSASSQAENQNVNRKIIHSTAEVDPVFEWGLILDETMTKPGADFFDIFYLRWQEKTEETIDIRIQEQLGLFRANFILLWLDDELIFRQQLPQHYDEIEVQVMSAIKQLNRKLLDKLFVQKQLEY